MRQFFVLMQKALVVTIAFIVLCLRKAETYQFSLCNGARLTMRELVLSWDNATWQTPAGHGTGLRLYKILRNAIFATLILIRFQRVLMT
jgi:hypothetical protein